MMLEKLKGTFDRSVAAVSVKSETMVESSRTKTAISNAQRNLENGINALGHRLYATWKSGSVDLALFTEEVDALLAIEKEIEALNAHLEEIKLEESRILGTQSKPAGVFCTNCGKALPAGSRFCDGCGTPVG